MASNKIVLYDLFTSRIFCFSCVPSVSCCCWWGLCRNVSWWCRQFWAGTRVVFGMSPRSWSGICRRPPRTRWLHHLAKHDYHISNIQFKISINPTQHHFSTDCRYWVNFVYCMSLPDTKLFDSVIEFWHLLSDNDNEFWFIFGREAVQNWWFMSKNRNANRYVFIHVDRYKKKGKRQTALRSFTEVYWTESGASKWAWDKNKIILSMQRTFKMSSRGRCLLPRCLQLNV